MEASNNLKTAVEELIRGRGSATRLGLLLQRKSTTEGHGFESLTRVLVDGVLGSFTRALTALHSCERSGVFQGKAMVNAGSPGSDDLRSEVTDGKRKSPPVRRGAYKRSCRGHPNSSKTITSKTVDDGHTWRKYGQKEIYNAKFPRSYFRCTHKHDKGCQATRHVQQSEDDPSMFVITYMGDHTCIDPVAAAHHRAPCMISFGSDTAGAWQPASAVPTPNQEQDEEVLSSLTAGPATVEGSAPMEQLAVGPGSEQGDVTSGLHPYTSFLEMDFMRDSFEIGDLLNFEICDLPL